MRRDLDRGGACGVTVKSAHSNFQNSPRGRAGELLESVGWHSYVVRPPSEVSKHHEECRLPFSDGLHLRCDPSAWTLADCGASLSVYQDQ